MSHVNVTPGCSVDGEVVCGITKVTKYDYAESVDGDLVCNEKQLSIIKFVGGKDIEQHKINLANVKSYDPEFIRKELKPSDIYTGSGIQLGTDPEVFVIDGNGVIVPAFSFLPGSDAPIKNKGYSLGKIYNDGFQAEFAMPPESCISWLVDNTRAHLGKLLKIAREKIDPNCRLSTRTVVEIPEILLMASAEHDVRLGCAPSLNAYDDRGEQVVDGRFLNIRFAGSHIHFGIGSQSVKNPEVAKRVVRALDGTVGLASIALFGNRENKYRRRFYGLAGEYRLPKHGLEYRVVSSRMIDHPVYQQLLFDVARYGCNAGLPGVYETHTKVDSKSVREVINNNDIHGARELLKQDKHILFNGYLVRRFGQLKATVVWDVLMGKSYIKRGLIEENWRLDGDWNSHAESCNCSVANLELA